MNDNNKISDLFNTLNVYDSRHSINEMIIVNKEDRTKFSYTTIASITYTSNYDTHGRLIEKTNVVNSVEFIIKLKNYKTSPPKSLLEDLADYLTTKRNDMGIFKGSTLRDGDLFTVRVQYIGKGYKGYGILIRCMSESFSNIANIHKKDTPTNVHNKLPRIISGYFNKYVK